MASGYEVAPIFLIRLAGVPFEHLERLHTPASCAAARHLLAQSNESKLDETLEDELGRARGALLESARAVLPPYLVFASEGASERFLEFLTRPKAPLSPRNQDARRRERSLLLYLQRVCAKNDSLSEFGPCGWGKIDNHVEPLKATPCSGIAARECFLERWTAHGIAAALNHDPEVRAEVEVPALEPHAFDAIVTDVSRWTNEPLRTRWLNSLEPIADLPRAFAKNTATPQRVEIMKEARDRLRQLGSARDTTTRTLYAAMNPIGEECFRDCGFAISSDLINDVATEAAPWIDLWRDNYAFVASRIAAGLRGVLEKMSIQSNGAAALPAFLRACEAANLSLSGPGLVVLAHTAFQEVKAAFRKRMKPHADEPEYALTARDCRFIRDEFDYPRFDEYTFPCADLQLAARSVEAVARGDYRWLLAELHPPVALLHHGFYWCCPDKEKLSEALAKTTFGRPHFHYGIYVADFTATTSVHLFDAPPGACYFVAPQRGNPSWPTVRPADAEVYVDEATGDVCLRKIDNREYLGSFARNWIIPLGFHPFQFGMAPQMPRLRCGKVIVQRRAWVVMSDELGEHKRNVDLLFGVERLRAKRDLPRHVYIRPTEQALRRSGAEARDKDTKPVFVDLESFLFVEIFARWLKKWHELEVTEMLPAPDDLLWREADGRRTFELRTLIVPRQ